MIENYKKVVFENYANFSGRATRSEYWNYVFATFIIAIILTIIDKTSGLTFGIGKTGILGALYSIFVLIPGLAVKVRRLHDIGKSGWLLLLLYSLIFFCAIALFIGVFMPAQSLSFNFWMTIPIIVMVAACIWFLILLFTDSEDGTNQYGKDPNDIFSDEMDEIGKPIS